MNNSAATVLSRKIKMSQVHALMAGGRTLTDACADAGIPPATFIRYRDAVAADGEEGLAPKWDNCGRRPSVLPNEEERRIAQRLLLQTGSQVTALRMLASLPECRDELANAILKPRSSKHAIPKSIRNAIRVTDHVVTYHQSPKQARFSFVNPRALTYMDYDGRERPITPGDLFERDDMSNNFLCWVPWKWGGDKCSDKFGVRVARGQNLMCLDVASCCFVSFNFLVRLRDSYRADDIWQWIGNQYRDVGMPRIGERWERGTWQARRLRGDDAPIVGGDIAEEQRLGGMGALGLEVIVSHSPTTKIIENRFNFLQRVMGTIPGQIGRDRGQMERETKVWMQCQRGERDPRDYFLSVEQASERIAQSLAYVNSEPVEGFTYQGVPAKLWSQSLAANPLKKLPAGQAYLFARDKREKRESRGNIMLTYTPPEGGKRAAWWFHHPELVNHPNLMFDVYLDEYNPSAGATLVIAEGPKRGTVLGVAELVDGAPQYALGIDPDCGRGAMAGMAALERRKQHMDAVISQYRAIGADGVRFAARQSRVDDGAGHERTVTVSNQEPRAKTPSREVDLPENQNLASSRLGARQPDADGQRLPKPRRRETNLDDLQALEDAARARGDFLGGHYTPPQTSSKAKPILA